MHTELLKKVVVEQRNYISKKFSNERIIEREIQEEVNIEKLKQILVITGVRRCGKSTLAHLLLRKKKYAYINFDDERLEDFRARDFEKLIEVFYQLYANCNWFVFDEIQNVNGWELFLTRFREAHNIIITGSNSKLLSNELSTRLTGRHKDITLFPFSFREFLKFRGLNYNIYLSEERAMIIKHLEEYIRRGGFPEADEPGLIATLYNDIINRDILLRKNIKFRKIFKEFAKTLISNFSSKINLNSLKRQMGVKSENTIKNYLELLEEAFIIVPITKFSFKLKEQLKEKRKIYVVDTGLINHVSFQFSSNIGKLHENLVAIELLRRQKLDQEIYYFETREGYEVDFVVREGTKIKQLIQACHTINEEARSREIRALLRASKELKCNNLLVITEDYEAEESIEWFGMKGKVKFVPLWKWLLGKV